MNQSNSALQTQPATEPGQKPKLSNSTMNIPNSFRTQRIPTLLAIAFFGLAATSQAAPIAVYEEDFATVDSGWSTATTYSNGDVLFAGAAPPTTAFPTRSLLLTVNAETTTRVSSGSPSGDFSIARTEDDPYSFQFDVRVSRTNMNAFLIFQDRNNNTQLPLMIQFTSAGNIVVAYWSGTANTNFTLLSNYAADTTYTFTFLTNPSTDLFSASVSGGTATIEDVEFRRTSGGTSPFVNFNSFVMLNDGGTASGANYDLYVDNINISIIPEPHAAALIFGPLLLMALRRSATR